MNKKIPTYSICNLLSNDNSLADIVVYDLQDFIQSHQNLVFPHRHSFYQILYITKGKGNHIIDFESYPVKAGMLFFLSPAQVHTWDFTNKVEGYLINFNDNYFTSYLANKNFLSQQVFFRGNHKYCAHKLSAAVNNELLAIFEKIMNEKHRANDHKHEVIRVLLLELILKFSRYNSMQSNEISLKHNYNVFRNFEELIEMYFAKMKLPKQYAEMLFITPNHLNALCNEVSGKTAGEIIRDRILLEAKRLLVNSNYSISEICYQLNFEDNSYFTKFFKKYANCTPDEFRKM